MPAIAGASAGAAWAADGTDKPHRASRARLSFSNRLLWKDVGAATTPRTRRVRCDHMRGEAGQDDDATERPDRTRDRRTRSHALARGDARSRHAASAGPV